MYIDYTCFEITSAIFMSPWLINSLEFCMAVASLSREAAIAYKQINVRYNVRVYFN